MPIDEVQMIIVPVTLGVPEVVRHVWFRSTPLGLATCAWCNYEPLDVIAHLTELCPARDRRLEGRDRRRR